MNFEDCCTIYLWRGEGRFERHVLNGVHWEERLAAARPAGGEEETDSVRVYFPLCKLRTEALSGGRRGRCYLVRGRCTEEIDEATERAFLAGRKVFAITEMLRHDYGAQGLRHWEIVAV